MIKRHENDMLFTQLWYGVLEKGGVGVAKYWRRQGRKTCRTVAEFHKQLIPPPHTCLSVKHVCYVQSERALMIVKQCEKQSCHRPRRLSHNASKQTQKLCLSKARKWIIIKLTPESFKIRTWDLICLTLVAHLRRLFKIMLIQWQ